MCLELSKVIYKYNVNVTLALKRVEFKKEKDARRFFTVDIDVDNVKFFTFLCDSSCW